MTTYISFIIFSVASYISFTDISVTTYIFYIFFCDYIYLFYRFFCDNIYLFYRFFCDNKYLFYRFFCDYMYLFYRFFCNYIYFFLYIFFFSVKTHIFIDFFSVAAYISFIDFSVTTYISFIEFFYDYICLFYRFFYDYIYLFTWSTISDQLSRTLICVFINTDQITWKLPLSNISNTVEYMDEQWGRFSDCAHAHADLGILCSHGMRVLVYDAERLLESVGSVVVVIYDARKVNKIIERLFEDGISVKDGQYNFALQISQTIM